MSNSPDPFGRFGRIVFEDFEYRTDPTDRPEYILAYCARDLIGRGGWEVWHPKKDPQPLGPTDLLVAYNAGAELKCRDRLGWSMPTNILCLNAEYCWLVSGLRDPRYKDKGLLDALGVFNIPHPFEKQKDEMRDRALNPAPFNFEERERMIAYCLADVTTAKTLFKKMLAKGCWSTDRQLDQALLRGRFVDCQRIVEGNGIPMDEFNWNIVKENREAFRDEFIRKHDTSGVYVEGVFKEELFSRLALKLDPRWPRSPTGKCRHNRDTLRDFGDTYPEIADIAQLSSTLAVLKSCNLQAHKGRCYAYTGPFRTKTGRNASSTTRFILNGPKWMRSLIQPPPGRSLAYVDVEGEEFGIAGLLSGDEAMWEAYLSKDPYLDFAIKAGLLPPDATKEKYPDTRAIAKQVVLGVQYGRGVKSTAVALKVSEQKAQDLLWKHRSIYRKFWKYIDGVDRLAKYRGCIYSVLGWRMLVNRGTKAGTLQNFPMQSAGAELMRAVSIELIKRNIMLVGQLHDGFLVEGPRDEIETTGREVVRVIAEISEMLFGKPLRSGVKYIHHPQRYIDEEAVGMVQTLSNLLPKYGGTHLLIPAGTDPLAPKNTP